MCKSFLQRVLSALWRRKSGALIVVTSVTVLLLLFQYHNVQHEAGEGSMSSKVHHRGLHVFEPRKNNLSLFNELKPEFVKNEPEVEKAEEVPNNLQSQNNNINNNNNDNMNRVNSQNDDGFNNKNNNQAPLAPAAEVAPDTNDVAKVAEKKVDEPSLGSKNNNILTNDQQIQHIQQHINNVHYKNRNFNRQGTGDNTFNSFDNNNNNNGPSQQPYVPIRRLFHLDLKGAPPKVEYFRKLFPILKQLGANAVLIEYEDMFPYEKELTAMVAKNHYSKEDVANILQLCRENGFEIIPLIQTFGHVEFILKHKEYQSLREVPVAPQAFCPSNNDSMLLIQEMVDQVMALHAGIKWLHIGCDEVYQLGMCSKCSQRNMDEGRDALFISHVSRVADYVRQRHNVIPIIWDDMLHHFTTDSMKRFELGKLVEPMVWTYVSDVYRFIPHETWVMYGEVFPYVWAASAFKGAFGEALVVPPVKMHLENNLAWLDVMSREQYRFQEFRGLAITGWQRYDHFATVCELLPAAIPSLAVNLAAVTHGFFNETLRQELYEALGCMRSPKYSTFINLEQDPYLWDKMSWCFFPGVTFFKVTERLENVRKMVTDYINDETVKKAWLNEYSVRHNYSSQHRIEAAMGNFYFLYTDVETLLRHARDTLREVFDEYTVAEWIELKIYPLLLQLENFRKSADILKAVDSWESRPLNPLPELAKYGVGIPQDDNAKQEKK